MAISNLTTIKVPAYPGNYTKGRSGKSIKEITIHHMAGRFTAQRCGEIFQRVGREGSSHYGIGYDGSIGNYVDENDTAWTNSNWDANCRAVTIETANDSTGGDWPVNDVTLRSLINLVADIAQRNGLIPLVKGVNLTWHQMYSATACPGPYLISKLDYIVDEANKIITNGSDIITTNTPVDITYQVYTDKWLDNVSQHDKNDANNGYAGIFNQSITGVYVNSSVGNVYYKVRTKGGHWLPEVKNREDYAGIFGKPIDGFMIRSDSTKLYYEVHDKTHGWLGAVSGYDENDHNYGYAGWTGYDIDAIMIWAEPIVTTTVIEKPKVEEPKVETPAVVEQIYRIRITWEDSKSQKGAYKNLDTAKRLCQELTDTTGIIYNVFDNDGNTVFTSNVVIKEEVVIPPEIVEPETGEPETAEPAPEIIIPPEPVPEDTKEPEKELVEPPAIEQPEILLPTDKAPVEDQNKTEAKEDVTEAIENDKLTNIIFNIIKKFIFYIINLFKNKGE